MRKVIPTNQLLAILDSLPDRPVKKSPTADEVGRYVDFYQLKSSTTWLPAHTIYNHYLNWRAGGKALSNAVFFKEFRKTFPGKKRLIYNYYQTDHKAFGLTDEQYQTLMTEVDSAEKERNRKNFQRYSQEKKDKKKST